MTSVITSVLNFTFGLLWKNIRDVTANINVMFCVGKVETEIENLKGRCTANTDSTVYNVLSISPSSDSVR